ncbi:nucleotidyltransferase domain-containing protein [Candidatus Margulisiibacteriota bacterium]
MKENKNLVTNLIKYIQKKEKTDAVYLFGSFADKTQNQDSDIDIGILFHNHIKDKLNAHNRLEGLKFDCESEFNLYNKIDLVDLELAPTALQNSIINGKLLVENNNYHIHKFENYILSKVEEEFDYSE